MKWYFRFWIAAAALMLLLGWSIAPAPQRENEAASPPAEKPAAAMDADEEMLLRVRIGGEEREMTMAEYLLGVLRAEMPAEFEPEALKAQTIAARTYTIHKMAAGEIAAHPGIDACDDITCCKAYKDAAAAAEDWGSMALYYEEKLARAVRETDGEILVYEGQPVLAVFFSSSGGQTQRAGDVWLKDLPYLQSVSSAEEAETVEAERSEAYFTAAQFRAAVQAQWSDAHLGDDARAYIRDIERNAAGYVTTLEVGGVRVKGNELRTVLGLRSPNFTVEAEKDGITFHVIGYGHGVGMSQYGAQAMARAGAEAQEIVEHYFKGAVLTQWKK